MPKGKKPIVQPALEAIYGEGLENLKTVFEEKFSDKTMNEAMEIMRKDGLDSAVLSNAVYAFVRTKLDFSFKKTGGRGKKSTVIPALIEYYGSEDALKTRMKELADRGEHCSGAGKIIEEESGVKISTLANIASKFDIEFVMGRKTKASSNSDEPVIRKNIVRIPVEVTCGKCGHTKTIAADKDEIGHAVAVLVRAQRCPNCNKWKTRTATYEIEGVAQSVNAEVKIEV